MLVINILILVCVLWFIVMAVKLYRLLHHKSLLLFIISGVLGAVLEVMRLEILLGAGGSELVIRSMVSSVWVIWTLGITWLYFEVKGFLKRKHGDS